MLKPGDIVIVKDDYFIPELINQKAVIIGFSTISSFWDMMVGRRFMVKRKGVIIYRKHILIYIKSFQIISNYKTERGLWR